MPDTTTRASLDVALAVLDAATSSDDMHRALAQATQTVTAATCSVVVVPERGQLRVAARAGAPTRRRVPSLLTSAAADLVLQTGAPTPVSLPDPLASLVGGRGEVWPVTAAGHLLAFVTYDTADPCPHAELPLLLSLLCRYAGSCLAHISDTEVREDQLRQRGAAIAALRRVADTDTLTGLVNRAGLITILNSLLSRGQVVGVVYVDLNGFKPVNDEFGHEVGDTVLRAVSDRLRDVLRPTDVVGRLGGDEFLVVVRDSDLAGLERVVERIEGVMEQQITVGRRRLTIGASCGVALADPGISAQQLVACADRAMYRRKRAFMARTPSPVIDLDSRR